METINTTEKEFPMWQIYVVIGIILVGFVILLSMQGRQNIPDIYHQQQTAQSVSSETLDTIWSVLTIVWKVLTIVFALTLWWNIIWIIFDGRKALAKYLNEPSKEKTQIQDYRPPEKVSDENDKTKQAHDKILTRNEDETNS